MGSWYAMTGYGIAFSRNSKYVSMFNKRLLDFRENGKNYSSINLNSKKKKFLLTQIDF